MHVNRVNFQLTLRKRKVERKEKKRRKINDNSFDRSKETTYTAANWLNFIRRFRFFSPPSPPRQKHFPYHRRRSWKIFRVSSRVDGSETILRSTEHRIRGPKGSIGIGERGPYATQSLYPRLMLARWAWAGHRYKSKPRRPSDT